MKYINHVHICSICLVAGILTSAGAEAGGFSFSTSRSSTKNSYTTSNRPWGNLEAFKPGLKSDPPPAMVPATRYLGAAPAYRMVSGANARDRECCRPAASLSSRLKPAAQCFTSNRTSCTPFGLSAVTTSRHSLLYFRASRGRYWSRWTVLWQLLAIRDGTVVVRLSTNTTSN